MITILNSINIQLQYGYNSRNFFINLNKHIEQVLNTFAVENLNLNNILTISSFFSDIEKYDENISQNAKILSNMIKEKNLRYFRIIESLKGVFCLSFSTEYKLIDFGKYYYICSADYHQTDKKYLKNEIIKISPKLYYVCEKYNCAWFEKIIISKNISEIKNVKF